VCGPSLNGGRLQCQQGDCIITNIAKPPELFDRDLFGAHGLPSVAAIKAVVLLVFLIAYGLGFVILYPLVQASVSKSAANGNDPMAFVGPWPGP
jgi:hypothetical protein